MIVLGIANLQLRGAFGPQAYSTTSQERRATFSTREKDPSACSQARRLYLAARGGQYPGSRSIRDSYVREFLALLGMSDVEFVMRKGSRSAKPARSSDSREKTAIKR